jgi:2-polyprenyl-6-hydroxyphenyl methylase/3-demethylubiquinone-9 3-methyltransferase
VHSFDFDAASVCCAEELRRRDNAAPPDWTIEQGSVLDHSFLDRLGQFDVVYSWGVLHHTGKLWEAVENSAALVGPGGKLAIALYNDQGWRSRAWLKIKQLYCSGQGGRCAVSMVFIPWFCLRTLGLSVVRRRNEFHHYRRHRGMSITHDWVDWLGGLPFEVAGFEEVVRFFRARGFILVNSKRTRRLGCNEFVFRKSD